MTLYHEAMPELSGSILCVRVYMCVCIVRVIKILMGLKLNIFLFLSFQDLMNNFFTSKILFEKSS